FKVAAVAEAAPRAPLTHLTGSSSSDSITNNPTLTLTGIETAGGTKVEYSIDGTTWTTSAPTVAQLVQGSNTIDVRQTDVAGNGSVVPPITFTLDTVAPAAPGVTLTHDNGASSSDSITNNPTLTLTGIETAGGTKVEYTIDGTTW